PRATERSTPVAARDRRPTPRPAPRHAEPRHAEPPRERAGDAAGRPALAPDRAVAAPPDRASRPPRRAPLRRRAVRRVRREPDDRAQRDAATGRRRARHADPGPGQLRRGAAGPPARGPADDLLTRDAPPRPAAELAAPRARDPAVDG